jgi:uncharacterized lipoprotein YmbA
MRHANRLLVVLLLAACGSSPKINYYTLSANPSGDAASEVNLDVRRFQTTEALSRSGILIAASPTRVEYYAKEHWVASVGELVQQKLQAEFGPHREGRPTYIVSGLVTALEQVDTASGHEARMAVDVVIRDPALKMYEAPLLERSFSATETASGNDPDAVVKALSRCAETIAAEIAGAVSKL